MIAARYIESMLDEVLNVELAKRLRKEQGRTVGWLIAQLGLSRCAGYLMFRKGLLPEDRIKRRSILGKLAKIFGVDERQLVLRLEATRAVG